MCADFVCLAAKGRARRSRERQRTSETRDVRLRKSYRNSKDLKILLEAATEKTLLQGFVGLKEEYRVVFARRRSG